MFAKCSSNSTSNTERTQTCSSSSDRTWTPNFCLRTNGHRTVNIVRPITTICFAEIKLRIYFLFTKPTKVLTTNNLTLVCKNNFWTDNINLTPNSNKMVSPNIFDLTVNAFADLVTEVFSGSDESQKAKLRTKLNQFSKISNDKRKRMPDEQINIILPPEMLEKILKLLNFKDICQANFVCKRWNEIIVKGKVLKKAAGKSWLLPNNCILVSNTLNLEIRIPSWIFCY